MTMVSNALEAAIAAAIVLEAVAGVVKHVLKITLSFIGIHQDRIPGQLLYHSDLVGRDAELADLVARFEGVSEKGGQALVLAADPGVGKSRLLSAFLTHPVTKGATNFVLQCSPEHTGTALYPVIRYLEWVAGTSPTDSDEARHTKLKRLVTVEAILPTLVVAISVSCVAFVPPSDR